jgi:hypothetical protein
MGRGISHKNTKHIAKYKKTNRYSKYYQNFTCSKGVVHFHFHLKIKCAKYQTNDTPILAFDLPNCIADFLLIRVYCNYVSITGAFLIPFAVMLILEGIPLFLIELGMGQKMRLGSLGVWNTIHPWLGGIGIASSIVTFFVALYYNVIITWCFYYLFNSLQV